MKMPHHLCAVVYPQFVIQVGDVTLQCPSAITSLSAISWLESHREQLQDLALRGSGWTFGLAPLSEQVRNPIESTAPGLVEQFEQTRTRFKKWTDHPSVCAAFMARFKTFSASPILPSAFRQIACQTRTSMRAST